MYIVTGAVADTAGETTCGEETGRGDAVVTEASGVGGDTTCGFVGNACINGVGCWIGDCITGGVCTAVRWIGVTGSAFGCEETTTGLCCGKGWAICRGGGCWYGRKCGWGIGYCWG